jgi:hypothetical protein
MRITRFEHRFVDHFPEELEPGVLYVSMPFANVAHRCACGCGKEVVTPLSPAGWRMSFDGKSISINPSIGNWSFPCRSHYWIKRDAVEWSYDMSRTEIEAGRKHAHAARTAYYQEKQLPAEAPLPKPIANGNNADPQPSVWSRFWGWFNH